MSATGLNRALMIALLVLTAIWLVLPFTMAVLWSLVDPAEPWTADKLIPPGHVLLPLAGHVGKFTS